MDAKTDEVVSHSSNLERLLEIKIKRGERPPFETSPGEFVLQLEGKPGKREFLARGFPTEWEGKPSTLIFIERLSPGVHLEKGPWSLRAVLEQLLSSLPGFVYLCENDPQWTMLYVSPGFKELTGYDPEEVIGNRVISFNDLIHPDHQKRLWGEWQRVLKSDEPFQGEYPIIRKDGEIRWVWEKGRGIRGENGRIILEGFITDITSLRDALEKARMREEEFRAISLEFKALLDAIPDNLTLQNPDLSIVWANRGAASGLGKEVSELIGRKCYELWQGRESPCPICPVRRAFSSGKLEEETVTTPDGRVWFIRGIPIIDDNGNVKNVVEVGRDITIPHKTQEELRESEEKFRILVELSADGIFLEDERANILDCNEAGARIYGYKKEEIIGKNVRDLVPEDFARTLPEVIDFDTAGVYEERLSKRKDGSIFPSEIATRLWTVGGKRRLLAYVRDISERRLAEETLRQSEEKWRTYIEEASDWIFTLDPSGKFTSINRTACESLGFKQEELIGRYSIDFVAPEARDKAREIFARIIQGEYIPQVEVPVISREGKRFILEIRGRRLFQGEKFKGTLHVGRDVTERKIAEEALKESEERFRSLYENSTIGLFRTTPDGQFLMANPALIKMLGFSSLEELSKWDFVKKGYAPGYSRKEFIEEIEKKGEVRGLESGLVRKDGSVIFIRESARAVRGPDGKTLYYEGTVEDITERKIAEDALRESQRRYQTLTEVSPVGIFRTDPEGKTIYVNNRWCQISGLKPEEALGDGWLKVVHPGDLEKVKSSWNAAVKAGVPSRVEYRFLRPDGKTAWVIGQATPELNEKGEIQSWVGTITEISELKETERALSEEKAKFEALAESAPYGLALVSREGKWLYANPKFKEITGYSLEEVPDGRTWFRKAFPDPQMRHQVIQTWIEDQNFVDQKEKVARVFQVRCKDGSEKTLKIITVQLPDQNFLISFEDITSQREMEEALRRSEEQYRTLVENISEGVDIVDAEDNFLFANPALERIFGVPPGCLVGRNLKEFTAEGFEKILEEETNKRRSGEKSKYEFRIRREDGEERDLEVSAVPRYDGNGNFIGTMAIISDITERKILEREAEKARSDFLFMVSHELKTPLFLMASAQEMLASLPEDQRRAKFLEYEELWNRNLIRLKMLIDNLVDAQRTEKMGLKLNLQRSDIRPLVEQSISNLQVLAQRKGIRFTRKFEALPPVDVDPEAIMRIMHNLLSNAVKFSFPNGEVEVVLKEEEGQAKIIVRDFGSGIDPEIQPFLFKPFIRAPEALKAQISGSGLGLYVSKVLVEAHGGTISLQSQPGKGTSVVVSLPIPSG
ncbi:MAG: PAS domain S-box protein [Caldiserica bacterium]|nr:PAS domain S-box protein [Caldisericota bacterium]MDH7562590.1 PAS domain S-box protein [Caldisericota bacterium]